MPLTIATRQTDTIIFGFDSAWSDNTPGAICALGFDALGNASFDPPVPANFEKALKYITDRKHSITSTVVALDQPTIVPNERGMRPAERVAASLLSFTGGGVQPANRSRTGLFDARAPIWHFKSTLGASDDSEQARHSRAGSYLVEVFPALALPGIHAPFACRLCAPKYNPKNRKFRLADWVAVTEAAAAVASGLGLADLGGWCSDNSAQENPTKGLQDCLDAAICALVGFVWRACDRSASALLGGLDEGYIVTPVSTITRARLQKAADARGIPFQ